jgi:hypothetical protein
LDFFENEQKVPEKNKFRKNPILELSLEEIPENDKIRHFLSFQKSMDKSKTVIIEDLKNVTQDGVRKKMNLKAFRNSKIFKIMEDGRKCDVDFSEVDRCNKISHLTTIKEISENEFSLMSNVVNESIDMDLKNSLCMKITPLNHNYHGDGINLEIKNLNFENFDKENDFFLNNKFDKVGSEKLTLKKMAKEENFSPVDERKIRKSLKPNSKIHSNSELKKKNHIKNKEPIKTETTHDISSHEFFLYKRILDKKLKKNNKTLSSTTILKKKSFSSSPQKSIINENKIKLNQIIKKKRYILNNLKNKLEKTEKQKKQSIWKNKQISTSQDFKTSLLKNKTNFQQKMLENKIFKNRPSIFFKSQKNKNITTELKTKKIPKSKIPKLKSIDNKKILSVKKSESKGLFNSFNFSTIKKNSKKTKNLISLKINLQNLKNKVINLESTLCKSKKSEKKILLENKQLHQKIFILEEENKKLQKIFQHNRVSKYVKSFRRALNIFTIHKNKLN